MVMTFTNAEEAKRNFANVSQNPEATPEEKTEALHNYMDAVQKDAEKRILEEAQTFASDNNVLQSRGQNVLTSEERNFFNAVIEEGGFTDEDVLPETTKERVFEDVEKEHKLLSEIGIQNLGAVTEFIFSDPEGAAVWGPLFDEIRGQLNASFRKEKITQLKLTAFVPISKDMLKLGPEWVERYVRIIIKEAMKAGLERGYVSGDGKNQPIGLLYNVKDDGGVEEKKSEDKPLTFKPGRTVINELTGVYEKLSEDLDKDGKVKDEPRAIESRVVMVTNPFDTFKIKANATVQNDAGVYVTNLPFNPIQTESAYVPKGKVLFFVKGEYIAAVGGGMDVKRYKETLALEDADVYIAKQYATGKPVDNNAAIVFDLDVKLEDDSGE